MQVQNYKMVGITVYWQHFWFYTTEISCLSTWFISGAENSESRYHHGKHGET